MLGVMNEVTVRRCPPALYRDALELVLDSVSADQRGSVIDALRPVAEQGVDVFDGLVVAESHGRLAAATWLQPQVGRTSTLWPPIGKHTLDDRTAEQLIDAVLDAAVELPVDLVQVLLDDSQASLGRPLEKAGFSKLAQLAYLMQVVPRKSVEPTEPRLTFDSPAMEERSLFEELITGTYESTLDCPALEGRRHIADTLAGYQSVGQHDPDLWFVVRWDSQPAGVLLVSPHVEDDQWEVVYMGVIPPFRGRGLGAKILARLRALASSARVGHIILAVDSANSPAVKMYDQAGFVEWARRTAYIRQVDRNRA
jgi:ribosomal protein S18 acetylase RimI-like enzyme